ncbi:MAG: hypothetical protein RR491_02360 [Lachnospiraceae bacterium]
MNPSSILLNNPALENIPPEKLKFLLEFASQNKANSTKDMMPLLMAANASAKKNKLDFSKDETALIVEIMKQTMTKEERGKVDMVMKLFQNMKS